MLRLNEIKKDYTAAGAVVPALKGLSVSFRANEFVSILGPSGCGKTTLLNLIGGLDRYTSGDLFIGGRSTKEFNDGDWDLYRNRSVGFVFQSYNLIPHQTVLGNVELALTIAGMGKAERTEKAKATLDKVGLAGQYYKRPNQLSGGQCQRVAIARALVNDPEILLADEPTGALDTVTSKQIMDLIREIAKERLVIMVTHNPELAEEYSTRIIRLLDGKIVSDSNPCGDTEESAEKTPAKKPSPPPAPTATAEGKKERAKMSFRTAFKLSLQNLFTKKKRSIMSAVAGSIGIIGVSMVLSISYGVQRYIDNMQNDMLSGNPIEISETAFNVSDLMSFRDSSDKITFIKEHGWVNIDAMMQTLADRAKRTRDLFVSNTITRDYVDYVKAMPTEYLAALHLDYGLDVTNNIYTAFRTNAAEEEQSVSLSGIRAIYSSVLKETEFADYASLIGQLAQTFAQAPEAEDYVMSQYNLLNGGTLTSKFAREKNEVNIVLGKDRTLTDLLLGQLGYYTQEEFVNLIYKVTDDARFNPALYREKISYDDLIGKTFTWYENDKVFTEPASVALNSPIFDYDPYYDGADGLPMTVVGILEPKENLSYGMLETGFYYTTAFAEHAIQRNKESKLAEYFTSRDKKTQTSMAVKLDDTSVVVYSGLFFDYRYYSYEKDAYENATALIGGTDRMSAMLGIVGNLMGGGASSGGDAGSLDTATFTLQQLGGVDLPSTLLVYPLNFETKEKALKYLDEWNGSGDIVVNGKTLTADERETITYTDMLSLVISMIKNMIYLVTIALVGFTSLALVVSCVMIAIITYVSVVERIKEIGVIRSLGGRKRDVSNLFTAETFIIGLSSGAFGIIVTYFLTLIINLIYPIAAFPIHYAGIMMCVSIGLTLISGALPSRSAAKKDPVAALRTE